MKRTHWLLAAASLALLTVGCNKKPPEPAPEVKTLEQEVRELMTPKVQLLAPGPAKVAMEKAVASIREYNGGDTVLRVNRTGKLAPGAMLPVYFNYEDMSPSALFSYFYQQWLGKDSVTYGYYYCLNTEDERTKVLQVIDTLAKYIPEAFKPNSTQSEGIYQRLLDLYGKTGEDEDKGWLFGKVKSNIITKAYKADKLRERDKEEDLMSELAKIKAMMQCMPLGTMMLNNELEEKYSKRSRGNGNSASYMMEDASANISGGRYIRHRLGIP